jgi:hypothetical protein
VRAQTRLDAMFRVMFSPNRLHYLLPRAKWRRHKVMGQAGDLNAALLPYCFPSFGTRRTLHADPGSRSHPDSQVEGDRPMGI